MNAVDTNILIHSHDPRDSAKQSTALSLLGSLTDGLLVWQVACEFLWASRKLEPFGFDQRQAQEEIRQLRRAWSTVLPTRSVIERGDRLMAAYGLSLWDALIVAACLEAGAEQLYKEDFGSQASIDGLNIVNPFAAI